MIQKAALLYSEVVRYQWVLSAAEFGEFFLQMVKRIWQGYFYEVTRHPITDMEENISIRKYPYWFLHVYLGKQSEDTPNSEKIKGKEFTIAKHQNPKVKTKVMQARTGGLNLFAHLIMFHHCKIIWTNQKISSIQGYFTGFTITGERTLPGMSTISGPGGLKLLGSENRPGLESVIRTTTM